MFLISDKDIKIFSWLAKWKSDVFSFQVLTAKTEGTLMF